MSNKHMSLWKKKDAFNCLVNFVEQFIAQCLSALIVKCDCFLEFLFCNFKKPVFHQRDLARRPRIT